MIEQTLEDGVAVVRMSHGRVSALDIELATSLADTLDALGADPEARAVVLTGTGRVFSAGVDLLRVLEGGAPYLGAFLPALERLIGTLREFSKPTVAAINGHAIAGGCVLACSCDARLMADGDGSIGVPELRVGVPFPSVALDPVRRLVPPRFHLEVLLLGGRFAPRDAVARGLADRIVPAESLLAEAVELAHELGGIRPECYALTKRQLAAEGPASTAADIDARVRELWLDDRTHADIRAYVERTLG